MNKTADEILSGYKRADGRRGQQDNRMEALARYFYPTAQGFQSDHAEGQQVNEQVFEPMGCHASKKLASFLFANSMGGHAKWFRLRFKDRDLNDNDAAKTALQEREDRMHEALQGSNFKSVGPETLRSLVVFGTAAMGCALRRDFTVPYSEDGLRIFPGLVFRNIWLRDIVFDRDVNQELHCSYQCLKLTPAQAIQMYGRDEMDAQLLEAEKTNPGKRFDFIWAVYPRYETYEEWQKATNGLDIVPANKKPFASVHVCKLQQKIVRDSGDDSLPRNVFIYSEAPVWADDYGYGAGDEAFPALRTLNSALRLELSAWEKSIDPPKYVTEDNMLTSTDYRAGQETVVRDINGIRDVTENTNWNATFLKKEESASQIRESFHLNEIVLPEAGTADMTAYEVSQRMQIMLQAMGSTVGRLEGMMNWTVERAYRLMRDNGGFTPFPEGIPEELDVEFSSPLIQAQKNQAAQATNEWIQERLAYYQATENPEILDPINWNEDARQSHRAKGVDERILVDKDQVEAVQQQRREAAQQQQRAAVAQQGAAAMASLSQARGE